MNNRNSYTKELDIAPAVIAIAHERDATKAVMLRKKDEQFELVRSATANFPETSRQKFAAEFIEQSKDEGGNIIVAGYNSAGVVFYRIDVPRVKEEELNALVKLQAEARFPLPVEKMGFAWRAGKSNAAQTAVTIAAARKDQLQNFVTDVSILEPAKIILDCEGLVKTWKEFFSRKRQDGLVLDIGQFSTRVCLVEDAQLSNVSSLDIGMDDFLAGRVETADRFNQDMKNVLEMFGYNNPAETPIYVLSDGRDVIKKMTSCLNSAGFNAKTMLPNADKLRDTGEVDPGQIYEYRVAIGLAAMSFESCDEHINIFEGLYRPKEKTKNRLYPLKTAGAIAASMFILLIIVSYLTDAAALKSMEKHFYSSEKTVNCNTLIERQKLIKEAAIERPDLLKLFSEINAEENNGILLDGFHFKKGQPIAISGQAKSDEQLYKFQENLLSKKGLGDVKIQRTKKEEKGNDINFNITFHYKNFTKKKGSS